jgi:hypothetical protein
MTVSVLLRLVPESLRAGAIVGEAELVETGERALVRDVAELVEFLKRTGSARRWAGRGESGPAGRDGSNSGKGEREGSR